MKSDALSPISRRALFRSMLCFFFFFFLIEGWLYRDLVLGSYLNEVQVPRYN